MKLQFDANQPFQLDAINAVADLFEGQPQGAPEFSVLQTEAWEGLFAGQARSELGARNQLLLPDAKLRSNAREIQLRDDIATRAAVWHSRAGVLAGRMGGVPPPHPPRLK